MSGCARWLVLAGSNIRPEAHLAAAAAALGREFTVVAASPLHRTDAVGSPGAPSFLNGAFLIETDVDRETLRAVLRRIEAAGGRVRTADRNAPRTLDLDAALRLLPDGSLDPAEEVDADLLRHVHAARPAADLLPDLVLPGAGGRTLREVADALTRPRES